MCLKAIYIYEYRYIYLFTSMTAFLINIVDDNSRFSIARLVIDVYRLVSVSLFINVIVIYCILIKSIFMSIFASLAD